MMNWGWPKGFQETAEFKILASYFSAYLLIPFEQFLEFDFRPGWRDDKRYRYKITLTNGDILESGDLLHWSSPIYPALLKVA
jgi:hypothetical protein